MVRDEQPGPARGRPDPRARGRFADSRQPSEDPGDADDQRRRIPFEWMHLGAQFRPDDREVPERRVDQLLAHRRIPRQDEAEDGGQQRERRKKREQAVVGHQCCFWRRLIIAELLRHRLRESQHGMPLLEPIGLADLPFDAVNLRQRAASWSQIIP